MDTFTVVIILLLTSATLIIIFLLAVPLFFLIIKGKLDRALSLLELIERRVALLEAVGSGRNTQTKVEASHSSQGH